MGPWGGESETAGGNLAVFRWKMAGRWVYDDDDDVDYFNLITSGLNSPHSSTDVECSGPKFPVVLWTDPSTSSSFVIEYIYIYIFGVGGRVGRAGFNYYVPTSLPRVIMASSIISRTS